MIKEVYLEFLSNPLFLHRAEPIFNECSCISFSRLAPVLFCTYPLSLIYSSFWNNLHCQSDVVFNKFLSYLSCLLWVPLPFLKPLCLFGICLFTKGVFFFVSQYYGTNRTVYSNIQQIHKGRKAVFLMISNTILLLIRLKADYVWSCSILFIRLGKYKILGTSWELLKYLGSKTSFFKKERI